MAGSLFDVENVQAAPEYGRRAMAAYFRSGATDQPSGTVMQYTIGNKDYVVLENCNGILAVYRVKPDGFLKALRRWPPVLDQVVTGERP